MLELRHANHCVYRIRYHMVFCVKYRKKLLIDRERIDFFKNVCIEIGERYHFVFDAIGTDGDHVHVFVGAEPKDPPSRVMQIIKSITARQIFKVFPEIRQQLWGGEFWSDGGDVGTVGEGITAEIIRDYIERQGSSDEKTKLCSIETIRFQITMRRREHAPLLAAGCAVASLTIRLTIRLT